MIQVSDLKKIFSIGFTMLSLQLFATDYKKEFSKSYSIDASALVELNTAFTNITINNWDKNEVEVFVFVTVDAASEEKANKIFDQIKIDLIGNKSKVEVKTNIGDQNSKTGNFSIHVEIKAPRTVNLKINNSFGDVTTADLLGKAEIFNDYGKIFCTDLNATDNIIKCTFGSITVARFGGGQLNSEFGNTRVLHLSGTITSSCEYGELKIDRVDKNCKSVFLDVSFGNCIVEIDSDAGFTINVTANMGSVEFGAKINQNKNENNWGSGSASGTIGDGSGKLQINSSFGNATISTR